MLTRKGFIGTVIAAAAAVVTGCAFKPAPKIERISFKAMAAGTHRFRIIGDVHLHDLRSLERVRLSAQDMESVLKHGMPVHFMVANMCVTNRKARTI